MKQEDTRERILEQALELFSEKGYDSVSVGEIARAVGIKAPSLYNHFPSKRAIFDAIVESTAAQYEADTGKSTFMYRTCRRTFRSLRRSQQKRCLKRCGRFLNTLCTMRRSAAFGA